MSKRKFSRNLPLAAAGLFTLLLSSCNRGVGCPANNMSVDEGWLEVVVNFFSILF